MKINKNSKRIYIQVIIAIVIIVYYGYSQGLNPNEIIYSGNEGYYSTKEKKYIHFGGVANIYKRNITTRQKEVIYNGNTQQLKVRLSPDRKYIASIQSSVKELYKPYHRWLNEFIILDVEGNIIHKIDASVMRYAWSPDGQNIAYITGEDIEGKSYKITGHYILDIKSGISKKIKAKGGELKWAEFDNNIYFKGWKYISEKHAIPMVYKYDPINNTFEETEYNGIHFSSNGKYYYHAPREGGDFKLFIRESNIDITERLKSAPLIHPYGEWLADDILILRDSATWGENYGKSFVFDLNKMDVVEAFDGKPLATYKKDGKLKIILYENPEIITIEK